MGGQSRAAWAGRLDSPHIMCDVCVGPSDPEFSRLGTNRMGDLGKCGDEALQRVVGADREWLDVAQDHNTWAALETEIVLRNCCRHCAACPNERHMMPALFALGI